MLQFMKLNRGIIMLFIVLVFVSIDLLTVKGIRELIIFYKKQNQVIIYSILWTITAFILIQVIYLFSNPTQLRTAKEFNKVYFLYGCLTLLYLPKLLFIFFTIADDAVFLLIKIVEHLKWIKSFNRLLIMHRIGFVISGVLFLLLLYGMAWGRFQYRIVSESLTFKNLPASFDGFKILQLSDIHAGNFSDYKDKLNQFVEAAMKEKPDMIVITGDFVNFYAEELDGLENIFYKLQAPYGEYGILGNHDYGDYHNWPTSGEKTANMQKLVSKLRYLGIRLLRNESVMIHKNNESIALAGVENWGPPPFQQYGDLTKALKQIPDSIYTILLSHDPRHWDYKVLGKTHVDLTLSGHTHGMQSGFRIFSHEWSPASLYYKRWGGLYKEHNQYLYINRGLGYVGIPIRIGMPAEITLFTLHCN